MATASIRHDRYPGAWPFSDREIDQRLFFGREIEITELFQQLLSVDLLVMYGKSGLGKTSILQAGIFPLLRKQGFVPLMIRFNHPELSPLDVCLPAIEQACRVQGIDYTPGTRSSLWEFFKTSVFWRNGRPQIPVLVLDQFEEIFTLHRAESRHAIEQELGQVLSADLPENIRARIEAGEQLPYSQSPPGVKALLSLREEYLGELEDMAATLPQILDSRFRLLPLDRETAKQAIIKPALLPQGTDFATPSFSYSDSALTEILDFLVRDTNTVEPFELQLLCRHVEKNIVSPRAAADKRDITVEVADFGGRAGLEAVLQSYYRDAFKAFSWRERRRARRLCGEGLLNPSGHRVSMEESQILQRYRVRRETLEKLTEPDCRLLRCEPRLGGRYFELSHDSLVKAALADRPWHVPRALRIGLVALAVLSVSAIIALVLVADSLDEANEWRNSQAELAYSTALSLSEEVRTIGHPDILESLAKNISDKYSGMNEADALPVERLVMSLASALKGQVSLARGNPTSGRTEYEEALKKLQGIHKTGRRYDEVFFALESTYNGTIQADLMGNRLNAAQDAFDAMERILSEYPKWFNDPDSVRSRHELHAQISLAFGRLANAAEQFELAGKAAQNKPAASDVGAQFSLAGLRMELGDVRVEQGNIQDATNEYTEAEALLRRLESAQRAARVDLRLARGAIEQRLGDVYLAQFRLEKAETAYRDVLRTFKRLAGDQPTISDWQFDKVIGHQRTASYHMAGYEQAIPLVNQYAALAQTNSYKPTGLRQNPFLSEFASASAMAQNEFNEAVSITEKWAGAHADNAYWKRGLAESLLGLGDAEAASGSVDRAVDNYQKATKIVSQLLKSTLDDDSSRRLLVTSEGRIAGLSLYQNEPDRARQVYESILPTAQQRAIQEPLSAGWQLAVSMIQDGLGDVHLARGDRMKAEQNYGAALDRLEKLAASDRINASRQLSLAVELYKLGSVERMSGEQPKGRDHLKRAVDIVQELSSKERLPPIAKQWPHIFMRQLQ
jgi:tetratricopeptide (TPR) repeat protein